MEAAGPIEAAGPAGEDEVIKVTRKTTGGSTVWPGSGPRWGGACG